MAGTVYVQGLTELSRAFTAMSRDLRNDLRAELRQVGEPVRQAAEQNAGREITRIGTRWRKMRLGVTQRLVYIAPRQRGRNTKRNYRRYHRPNLAGLLLERAMVPALDRHEQQVVLDLERMLGRLAGEQGF